MENKIIKVEIMDGGSKKTFSVRLFQAMEGIQFLDGLVAAGQAVKISDLIKDLLPLASLVDPDGKVIDEMSVSKIDTYFQNPLSALELAYKVLEHQMVFMNESEIFRPLIPAVKSMFKLPISDSVTQ